MSSCEQCKADCMKTSNVNISSCMNQKCPQCTNGGDVCTNQNTFNRAFRNAIKNMVKKDEQSTTSQVIFVLVYMFLIVWALMLASRMPSGNAKSMHYMFAIIAPPIYIISYYVGQEKVL